MAYRNLAADSRFTSGTSTSIRSCLALSSAGVLKLFAPRDPFQIKRFRFKDDRLNRFTQFKSRQLFIPEISARPDVDLKRRVGFILTRLPRLIKFPLTVNAI